MEVIADTRVRFTHVLCRKWKTFPTQNTGACPANLPVYCAHALDEARHEELKREVAEKVGRGRGLAAAFAEPDWPRRG